MRLPLYIAASALAIFATSCAKEKIAPNGTTTSTPNDDLNYNSTVVAFDPSGGQDANTGVVPGSAAGSNNAVVTGSVQDGVNDNTAVVAFDPSAGQNTNTGVVPGTAAGSSNAVVVTQPGPGTGTETSSSQQR